VVILAAVARLAVVARGSGSLDDPDNYLPLARSLAEGRGFALKGRPTANRPPFYPLVLAPIAASCGANVAWGVAALHVSLGAGTVFLTARTARRWGLSENRALLAGAIVALDPVLLSQARGVMTEPLAAFLVAGAMYALAGEGARASCAGGLFCGLAALTRPSLLPFAGLTTLAALVARPGILRERLKRGAIIAGTTAVVLLPWGLRNALVFGEPIVTTTHGGYTLALANNATYYDDVLHGPAGSVWSGPRQFAWFARVNTELSGLSEPEADRRLRAEAIAIIRERPSDFLLAALARLGRFWGLAPSGAVYPRSLRIASAVWTVPLWLAAAAGVSAGCIWKWPRVVAPTAILALTLVHVAYWTDLRMRAPIVPAIALAAASAQRAVRGREP
jgi:hypothetical protein